MKIIEDDFVACRQACDKQLSMPKLILESIQLNIRDGRLPAPEGDGRRYLKIPRNSLMAPPEAMKVNEMTIKSAKELVAEATAAVETLPAKTAVQMLGRPDIVFVDLREKEELEKSGRLKGAVAVPRGLLEFQADPKSSASARSIEASCAVLRLGRPFRAGGKNP